MSLEFTAEPSDNIPHSVQQECERWANGHIPLPAKVLKHYRRGEMELCLLCRRDACKFFVHIIARGNRKAAKNRERERSHALPGGVDNGQGAVFVYAVKIVNDQQRIVQRIPSVIRLAPLNEVASLAGAHSFYLEAKYPSKFRCTRRFFAENGECNRSPMCTPVGLDGERPRDVVERRAEIVRHLAGDNSETGRNLPPLIEVYEFVNSLVPIVTDRGAGTVFQEHSNLGIELLDIFLGPF